MNSSAEHCPISNTQPALAHRFAGLRNTAEHVGQVQQTHFVLDNFLIGVH
jgi:hypothetical protein